MDDSELVDSLSEELNTHVRNPARRYTSSALRTLHYLMTDKNTSASVRRGCANDLLAQGWGRADTREDTGGQRDLGKLVINIIRLTDGSSRRIGVDISKSIEIAETVDAATVESPIDVTPRRIEAK